VSFDEGLAVGLALGKKKFSGGGEGDKWTYPADWIQIPSPASNEVYCVGTISLGADKRAQVLMQNWGGEAGTCVVDWGDGNTTDLGLTTSVTHTYIDGTGHLTDSGIEQFLIKVTMSNPADWGGVHINCAWESDFCLALAYGADTALPQAAFYDYKTIHQVQLPNITTLGKQLSGLQALKKVITPTKLTTLGTGETYVLLSGCFSLEEIDLSEVTTIASPVFQNNYRIAKLDMPKLTSICNNGITSMYALREINAPLLTSVGDYGLARNYSLTKFTYAEGCTFGTSACQYCYNLFPNPAP